MSRMLQLAVGFTAMVALSMGCASHCDELADVTCTAVGEQAAECQQVRTKAESASSHDQRSCEIVLEMTNKLSTSN